MLVTAQAQTASVSDIDGDGYADPFVGAPEGIGGHDVRGGYVAVVPGGPDSASESGDRIGADVTPIDLDGNGPAP